MGLLRHSRENMGKGATMLIHMLAPPMYARLLLVLLLFSCGSAEAPQPPTRLGDAWSGESGAPAAPLDIPSDAPLVVFLGDSLSAGLHLEADLAFPALLQRRLSDRGTPFRLVNAGLSGDTTAGGLRRADWILKQAPDLVVVELGANDGLRGLPLEEIESNLKALLKRIDDADAKTLLLGMHIPPSYGATYASAFQQVYDRLAKASGVTYLPEWLAGVGGVPSHNLSDGMHPNAKGHELLASNIEDTLQDVLQDL